MVSAIATLSLSGSSSLVGEVGITDGWHILTTPSVPTMEPHRAK